MDVQTVTPEMQYDSRYLALVWDGLTWGWIRAALRDIILIPVGLNS